MTISYSLKAKEDLQMIRSSVLENFDDDALAESVLKEITGAVRNLGLFPYIGRELSKAANIQTDYRYLFCRHNYIFYRIGKDSIYIIRILNERQDYMRNLFENFKKMNRITGRKDRYKACLFFVGKEKTMADIKTELALIVENYCVVGKVFVYKNHKVGYNDNR